MTFKRPIKWPQHHNRLPTKLFSAKHLTQFHYILNSFFSKIGESSANWLSICSRKLIVKWRRTRSFFCGRLACKSKVYEQTEMRRKLKTLWGHKVWYQNPTKIFFDFRKPPQNRWSKNRNRYTIFFYEAEFFYDRQNEAFLRLNRCKSLIFDYCISYGLVRYQFTWRRRRRRVKTISW